MSALVATFRCSDCSRHFRRRSELSDERSAVSPPCATLKKAAARLSATLPLASSSDRGTAACPGWTDCPCRGGSAPRLGTSPAPRTTTPRYAAEKSTCGATPPRPLARTTPATAITCACFRATQCVGVGMHGFTYGHVRATLLFVIHAVNARRAQARVYVCVFARARACVCLCVKVHTRSAASAKTLRYRQRRGSTAPAILVRVAPAPAPAPALAPAPAAPPPRPPLPTNVVRPYG